MGQIDTILSPRSSYPRVERHTHTHGDTRTHLRIPSRQVSWFALSKMIRPSADSIVETPFKTPTIMDRDATHRSVQLRDPDA